MWKLLSLCLLISVSVAAQEIPKSTSLPGDPFFIKKTWAIGGAANWDYLTIDPKAQQLYIAHGPVVQVVSIESGELVSQISGFREAHSIALDDTGAYGRCYRPAPVFHRIGHPHPLLSALNRI